MPKPNELPHPIPPIHCDWCQARTRRAALPELFCWTRMQAESGQPLESIVSRKESERLAGDGLFFWGIGNSVNGAYALLRARCRSPQVFFSVMRSRPQNQDVAPSRVLLWTHYRERDGAVKQIPSHSLVLSRGTTNGGEKDRHYAIACYAPDPLLDSGPRICLDASHLCNLGGAQIGFSQVTAVVQHSPSKRPPMYYEIAFRARIVEPGVVRLLEPRVLPDADRKAVEAMSITATPPQLWRDYTRDLRVRLEADVGFGLFAQR